MISHENKYIQGTSGACRTAPEQSVSPLFGQRGLAAGRAGAGVQVAQAVVGKQLKLLYTIGTSAGCHSTARLQLG